MNVQFGRGAALAIPMSAAQRADWQARLSRVAILDHLGVRMDLTDDYAVRLVLERSTVAHAGGLGTDRLNGAMIAGMMDCAMSIAGILHFRGRTCGTVQLSIQFMKPVRCKAPVVECRAVRRASGVVFLEARLLEENHRCAVMATGIVGVTRVAGPDNDGRENWHGPVGVEAAASVSQTERAPTLEKVEE